MPLSATRGRSQRIYTLEPYHGSKLIHCFPGARLLPRKTIGRRQYGRRGVAIVLTPRRIGCYCLFVG